MELFRIHAYEVTPQRLSKESTAPRGGAFSASADFSKSLDEYFEKSKLHQQAAVDLRRTKPVDGSGPPTHELRNQVIDYCYGAAPSAKSAALGMARSLGKAMDNRSDFTLLMLAAYRNGGERRLVMWAFPKDEPYHFSVSGDRAKLKILKDAFSRSSSFKKAVLFEGTNTPNSFWSGKVIDKQGENGFGTAADYWINLFLNAQPSLSGKAGTRLLARCLRRAHDALSSQNDKDEISSAIVAVRASRKPKWSLNRFANEYLADGVKQTFIDICPPESRNATFSLNRDEFDRKINFRVFRLKDNVMVSAPFGTVGKSVKLDDGHERRLTCEGIVVSEKVRAQNVG